MSLRKPEFTFVLSLLALCLAPVGAMATSAAPAPTVVAAALQPSILAYRATYKMTLDSVRNGSHIQSVTGELFTETQDACDGWITEQRLNLAMSHDEGGDREIKSSYATWESKNGTIFRFNYRNVVNGTVQDEYRGTAHLDAPGQKGVANYTIPAVREMQLPVGSYFPTSHTLAIIRAAIAQKPIFSAHVFDGTDEHGLSEINSVIGAQRPVTVDAAKTGLGTTPAIAWPVRLAFFPYEQEESVPDYEMDMTILPNGVSEYMLMDYGEFRLRGALEKLELVEKPDC